MLAALFKPTLHWHSSKACVMQNMVLHGALHPPIKKKGFFYKDAIAKASWVNASCSLRGSRRSGIIVWFGKVIASSLVGKQNQWYSIWVVDVEVMLSVYSLLLCSYILGTKEKLSPCAIWLSLNSFLVEELSAFPIKGRVLYFSQK